MSRYCLFIQEIILNQSILNFIYFVQNVLETLLFSLNNLGIVGHVGRPLPDLPLQGVHFSIQLEQQLLQSRHLLRGHLQVVGSRGVLQFRHQAGGSPGLVFPGVSGLRHLLVQTRELLAGFVLLHQVLDSLLQTRPQQVLHSLVQVGQKLFVDDLTMSNIKYQI